VSNRAKTKRRLKKIEDTYGDRDFLKLEIVAYLRSVGRHVDLGEDGSEQEASKSPATMAGQIPHPVAFVGGGDVANRCSYPETLSAV
jgi:hypothetical protein